MKVLVTGGAAYVGRVLVPMLLDRGIRVTVVDDLLHGGGGLVACEQSPGFRFVRGDVRYVDLMRRTLSGQDAIVHLAAYVGYPICKAHPQEAESTNVDGTRIIDALRGRTPLVLASTCSVYGASPATLCSETTPVNPLTLYSASKVRAERSVLDSGSGVVLRFATGFGWSSSRSSPCPSRWSSSCTIT
jgi:nucleoside-diphosphate-sugar epimerase